MKSINAVEMFQNLLSHKDILLEHIRYNEYMLENYITRQKRHL